jgi:hypothetical protein
MPEATIKTYKNVLLNPAVAGKTVTASFRGSLPTLLLLNA